jgi:hypothetical protein
LEAAPQCRDDLINYIAILCIADIYSIHPSGICESHGLEVRRSHRKNLSVTPLRYLYMHERYYYSGVKGYKQVEYLEKIMLLYKFIMGLCRNKYCCNYWNGIPYEYN